MEEAWELAVVSEAFFDQVILVVGLIFSLSLAGLLFLLMNNLLWRLAPSPNKILLDEIDGDDRKLIAKKLERFGGVSNDLTKEYDEKNPPEQLEGLGFYLARNPDFIEKYKKAWMLHGPKYLRWGRVFSYSWMVLALLLVSASYIFAKSLGDDYVLDNRFVQIQDNSGNEIQKKLAEITTLSDVIVDLESSSVSDVQSAISSLPARLTELEEIVSKQIERNERLTKQVSKEQLRLKDLKEQQSVLSQLTESEVSVLRGVIYTEARRESSRSFWLGLFLAFLLQVFFVFLQPVIMRKFSFSDKTRGRDV